MDHFFIQLFNLILQLTIKNERTWITKRLDLYANWSRVLENAEGINVIYNEGEGIEGTAPVDNSLYLDNVKVTAGAASKAPAGKVFDHWIVETWNGTQFVHTDDSETVLPGETFTISSDDAKVEVIDSTHNKYTVQLVAKYKTPEVETPTHIAWYSNYGDANEGKGELYRYDKIVDGKDTLSINDAVTICPAPSRAGYTFKGWTKTQGGTDADFLVWTGSGYTDIKGNAATQVAADEKQNETGYDDMFAVWEETSVTINYAVADTDASKGSVSVSSETVYAISGKYVDDENKTVSGSIATAASDAYEFDYWTCDDGTEHVGNAKLFKPVQNSNGIYEAHTYYAHFTAAPEKGTVVVHHYLKGTTISVAEDESTRVVAGLEYKATPVTTYQEKDLTPVSYDPSQTITVKADSADSAGNTIIIYYTLPLTITAKTDSKDYDGKPLKGEYTITGVLAADKAGIEASLGTAPSITNVSESPKTYQATVTGIPSYYVVDNQSGTLTISRAAVTVKADDKSKVYGTADPKLTATVTGLYGEDTVTYTLSRETGEELGKKYVITPKGDVTQGNYTVSYETGLLTITGEGYVSITKVVTSKPKEGDAYGLGEVIKYKITAKNEGETVTLYNVVVADEMTDQTWTIPVLGPGEVKDFIPNSHTVTEDDIKAGTVINKATIKSGTPDNPNTPDTPENPDIPFTPDPPIIIDVPTEDPNPHLTITKVVTSTPANGKTYALGETISYKITVKNDGNLTITDIKVTDKLEGVVLDNPEEWAIASLAPDESKELTASYTVKEADILAGKVKNEAVGQFQDPREPLDPPTTPEDPPVINVPTEEPPEVLTEAPKAYLVITKVTTSSPEDEKYKLGEGLTYTITVKNEGNVTVTNITVTDAKTKGTWEIGDLAPGEELEKPLATGYMVSDEDVIQGKVINEATATGTVPEGVELTVKKGHTEDEVAAPVGKTIKVIFYTNYPDGACRTNDRIQMLDEYSDIKTVEIPYRLPGFVAVFGNDMMPINYDFTGWELHRPNKTQNVDEGDTISDAGTSSIASASSSSDATDPTEGADYIFYAQWEDNGYRFPTHGAVIIDKPDPDPDDPDPDDPDPDDQIDDEPTPLSPFEEIPEEDLEEPDTPYAGWEEEPDEEISEEPTPLSPYTGDDRHTAAWGFVSLLSLAGIAVLGRKRREEE